MSAIEELEKLAEKWHRGKGEFLMNEEDAAMAIEALLPRLRTEERDGKREAFEMGSDWRVCNPDALGVEAGKEAERRYP